MLVFNNSWTFNVGSLDFYFLIAFCLAPEHQLTLLPVCRHIMLRFGSFYEFAPPASSCVGLVYPLSLSPTSEQRKYYCVMILWSAWSKTGPPESELQPPSLEFKQATVAAAVMQERKQVWINMDIKKKKTKQKNLDVTVAEQQGAIKWLKYVTLARPFVMLRHITSHHNRVTWGQIPVGGESLWRQRSL